MTIEVHAPPPRWRWRVGVVINICQSVFFRSEIVFELVIRLVNDYLYRRRGCVPFVFFWVL